MDINAGEATIEQLYSKGYIRQLSDLYKLTPEQLLTLDKWKEKSVSNFLKSLEESKAVPFSRLLFAIGIRHIGETTAKVIAQHFHNMDAIAAATKEELLSIGEVGEKLADSIICYFSNEQHLQVIKELKEYGLQMEEDSSSKIIESEILRGMTVVISGNFSISRDGMKALIEAHSGKVGSSISSNTTYMVAGEKCGPSKLSKAEKLGVKVIGEEEFMNMLKN